jgi:uncharacterized Zn-binding protein involved in type VI secretion
MPGQPAVVMNDRIMGMCAVHQVPSPSGAPMPSPAPLPFSAPLLQGLCQTVTIGRKPVAVQGSTGMNTPPHVGLHASDPFLSPTQQEGRVLVGSSRVTAGGKPLAYTGCQVSQCAQVPAQVVGSAAQVLVGP